MRRFLAVAALCWACAAKRIATKKAQKVEVDPSKLPPLADVLADLGLDAARRQAERSSPAQAMRRFASELREQSATIDEGMLGKQMARTPGVRMMTVSARRGALQLSAAFDDHEPLDCSLVVDAIRFAPRGAKELVLHVTPDECTTHTQLRPLVGTFAGVVAHGLWAMVLGPPPEDVSGAIVDRERDSRFRVDLRHVPAVREAMRKGGAQALVVDTLALGGVSLEDGAMKVRYALPRMT